MSDATLQAVGDAIRAHVQDECGRDVTGWEVTTEITSLEQLEAGTGGLFIIVPDWQSPYLTDGLFHAAIDSSGGHRAIDDIEDDDD